jgi:hypothetical protein
MAGQVQQRIMFEHWNSSLTDFDIDFIWVVKAELSAKIRSFCTVLMFKTPTVRSKLVLCSFITHGGSSDVVPDTAFVSNAITGIIPGTFNNIPNLKILYVKPAWYNMHNLKGVYHALSSGRT